jgi:mxaA protein
MSRWRAAARQPGVAGRRVRTRATPPALAATALSLALALPPAVAAPAPSPRAAALQAAVVEQPRAFGHVVGDVVTQRVLLQRDGRAFEPAALPAPGRIGAWLERRAPRLERARDGRSWLVVEYQVINAPQALRTVALPAWTLAARTGGAPLGVGAWRLSVGPLTPRWSFGEAGLEDLRPDRGPPRVDTAAPRRAAFAWSAVTGLALLAWLAWALWRERRDRLGLPFARAWRELRGLDDTAPEAWQEMHRAFDRSAGRVVQAGTLAALFERAPHLAGERAAIERFYAASQALFFAPAGAPAGVSPHALCRALRALERRHAR